MASQTGGLERRHPYPLVEYDVIILGSHLQDQFLLLTSVNDLRIGLEEIDIYYFDGLRNACHPIISEHSSRCSPHPTIGGCCQLDGHSLLVSHETTCGFVPKFTPGLVSAVSDTRSLTLNSREMHPTSPKGGDWKSFKYRCI